MKLFTITYADGQPCPFTEYRNRATEKLWRFENNAMIDIVQNHLSQVQKNEFVGLFSHKFESKTKRTKQDVEFALKFKVPQFTPDFKWFVKPTLSFDIVNFSPPFNYPIAGKYATFMDWSAAGHGETLRDLIKACCEHIGFQYHNNPEHIVYANQFAARKAVYVDYINTVIKPCLALLEGPLWETVNQPANYGPGLKAEKLKALTGLDFYNYLPFVLERMTMQYIANKNIKTLSL
jgi:hypothetical protein